MKLQDSDIKAGRIEYETGSVEVEVAFTVLLFRPFRNEIIDATVTTVTEVGCVLCFWIWGRCIWAIDWVWDRMDGRSGWIACAAGFGPLCNQPPPHASSTHRWGSSPTPGRSRASMSTSTCVLYDDHKCDATKMITPFFFNWTSANSIDRTPSLSTQQQMPQDYGFDAQEGVWRTSDMEVEIRSGCGVRMRIVGVDITPGRMVSEGWGGERGFLCMSCVPDL